MELNYENKEIKKLFINILLKKGLKNNSEKILKKILIELKKITNNNPNIILKLFINNLSPKIKVIELPKKKRFNKKKKKMYLFMFLNKDKQIKISIKWLFSIFKNKSKKDYRNIAKELIQISKNKGKIINLKKNYYKDIKKLKFFY